MTKLPVQASSASLKVVILARMGFSAQLISERTGLSKNQVYARMQYFGIRLKEYRNGESELAQKVVGMAETDAENYYEQLRDKLIKVIEDKKGN